MSTNRIRVGDPAPKFTLPAVDREGTVSLAAYRGRSPVLLAITRGMWCSFCRRYIAQLGGIADRLQRLGTETLVIVASDSERTRLYLRHRPTRVFMAADPDMGTHRAYGLAMPPLTPAFEQTWKDTRVGLDETAVNSAELVELTGAVQTMPGDVADRGGHLSALDLVALQHHLYPYEMTETEQRRAIETKTLATGQFLVDREGIVRWTKVQDTSEPPAALWKHAGEQELLAAVQALTG